MSVTAAGAEREEPPRRLLAESGPVTGHLPAGPRPARPFAAPHPPPGRGLAAWPGLCGPRDPLRLAGIARGRPPGHPCSATPPCPAPRGFLGSSPTRGIFLNSIPPEVGPVGPPGLNPSQVVGLGCSIVQSDSKAAELLRKCFWTRPSSVLLRVNSEIRFEVVSGCVPRVFS